MKALNHPFVGLMAVVWLCSTIACFPSGSAVPIVAAAVVTVLCGIGYFVYKVQNE